MVSLTIVHVSNISSPLPDIGTAVLVASSAASSGTNINNDNATKSNIAEQGTLLKLLITLKHDHTNESKSKVITYEAQYTLQQISSDLKLFDESSFLLSVSNEKSNTEHDASDLKEIRKLHYLIQLLKYATDRTTNATRVGQSIEQQNTKSPSSYFLSLEYIQDETKTLLRFALKERLPNTMVRIIYSTTLSCVDDDVQKAADGRNSITAVFDLTVGLIEEQGKFMDKIETLQQQYQLLERSRDGWKDTAEKLTGQWEDERSELFQNFCTLYTNKKDHDATIINQLKSEIDQLKGQIANITSKVSNSNEVGNPATKVKSEIPECLQDIPDDHQNVFDDEMVRRLAQGQRIPVMAIKTEDTFEEDVPMEQTITRKRNYNPISGAMEYMNADDALQDIIDPTEVPSQQLPKKIKSNSTGSTGQRIAPKKSTTKSTAPVKKKLNPAKNQNSKLSDSNERANLATKDQGDGGSETGSDSDFIDKNLEAQILADLEALKKG